MGGVCREVPVVQTDPAIRAGPAIWLGLGVRTSRVDRSVGWEIGHASPDIKMVIVNLIV